MLHMPSCDTITRSVALPACRPFPPRIHLPAVPIIGPDIPDGHTFHFYISYSSLLSTRFLRASPVAPAIWLLDLHVVMADTGVGHTRRPQPGVLLLDSGSSRLGRCVRCPRASSTARWCGQVAMVHCYVTESPGRAHARLMPRPGSSTLAPHFLPSRVSRTVHLVTLGTASQFPHRPPRSRPSSCLSPLFEFTHLLHCVLLQAPELPSISHAGLR